jgi:hypothetical protein
MMTVLWGGMRSQPLLHPAPLPYLLTLESIMVEPDHPEEFQGDFFMDIFGCGQCPAQTLRVILHTLIVIGHVERLSV